QGVAAIGPRRSGAVAERDADARAGPGDLRHRVLPGALTAAAGDEQVASPEVERPARSPRARTKQEAAGRTDRHDGHERFFDVVGDAVAVPGDAVAPVAVEVETHRVERHSIAPRESSTHLLDERQERRVVGLETPPGREARPRDRAP